MDALHTGEVNTAGAAGGGENKSAGAPGTREGRQVGAKPEAPGPSTSISIPSRPQSTPSGVSAWLTLIASPLMISDSPSRSTVPGKTPCGESNRDRYAMESRSDGSLIATLWYLWRKGD